MIRDFPEIKQGWWAKHVGPDLSAAQVAEHVAREHPGHPALGKLQSIARNFERARADTRERLFRCAVCRDATWRENPDGTVARCRGALSSGCPADVKRLERLKERAAKRTTGNATGEGGSL